MKTHIRFCLALILVVLLITSTALADSICSFTFTSQGRTYHVYHRHDGKTSQFDIPDKMTLPFNDMAYFPGREYYAYLEDRDAAIERHTAVCPYTHNLGDDRVPMGLIYGGAALAVVAILVVHKRRKSLRAVING